MTFKRSLTGLAMLGVTACSQTLQAGTASEHRGASRVQALNAEPAEPVNFRSELRALSANAKPLVFPARMGLARIENGGMTPLPEREAEIWRDTATDLGTDFGSFAALNTFTAAPEGGGDVMSRVRRAATQQGLDYVLVYSVEAGADNIGTAFSLLNLTIIGAYVVPTRDIEAQVTLSAAFVDVETGHIHATLVGHGKDGGVAPARRAKRQKTALIQEATDSAVAGLADEAAHTLRQLAEQQGAKRRGVSAGG